MIESLSKEVREILEGKQKDIGGKWGPVCGKPGDKFLVRYENQEVNKAR